MMTSAQVVETSVIVTNNSPSRDYSHPDDQTTQTTETPGFKTFTVLIQSRLLVDRILKYVCLDFIQLQKEFHLVWANFSQILCDV